MHQQMTQKHSSPTTLMRQEIDAEKRKRLGQYFTGDKLARFLATIAYADGCSNAIDPMCGQGDMLVAVKGISSSIKLSGIEIDRLVLNKCKTKLDNDNDIVLLNGNAFDWSTIASLPRKSYDLVITNPPYVRYQMMANSFTLNDSISDAEAVRQGLLGIVNNIKSLDPIDRQIFINLIKNYSGLSDLAIPSWILCALLTNVGGKLALVLPDSWLNRDYAYIIHYLLLKFFRVQYIIEDLDRTWFKNAQIKTNLLIARRIPRRDNLDKLCRGAYLHVGLSANTIDNRSIVGQLFNGHVNPENAFVNMLKSIESDERSKLPMGVFVVRKNIETNMRDVLNYSFQQEWFRKCEPAMLNSQKANIYYSGRGAQMPQPLLSLIKGKDVNKYQTIEQMGYKVGQGLRTGANFFFYCNLIKKLKDKCIVETVSAPTRQIAVPYKFLRPVLRRQCEMPLGYIVDMNGLKGRVLLLDKYCTYKRKAERKGAKQDTNRGRPLSLDGYIGITESINLAKRGHHKYIYDLSAVRTNILKENHLIKRHWYMLPKLQARHLPDLCVPRINGMHPKTIMNDPGRAVVDANYSTIWADSNAEIDAYAILAIFNSAWMQAAMELSGTIMGGGALKLEATHIRKLPIPIFMPDQLLLLSECGRKLIKSEKCADALAKINQIMAIAIFGKKDQTCLKALEGINSNVLSNRLRR